MTHERVRVVVLAAGMGTRLRPLTDGMPKCLTPLMGRSLLQRQLDVYQAENLTDVSLVVGYRADQLARLGQRHFVNADFETTNMVESLMAARELFDGRATVLMVYGDIAFERRLLRSALICTHAIGVVVDTAWRRLWDLRMEDPLADAETLKIGSDGRISELGRKPGSYADIEGQYIGMVSFRPQSHARVLSLYDSIGSSELVDGKPKRNMFMTSFVQRMIDHGFDVGPAFTQGGWVEVDSLEDLSRYERAAADGSLRQIYADI